MGHALDMLARLPRLYRDGELVRDVLELPALQLEILDEEGREVQRAHWFNSALELDEAAKLAAILDIALEPWHTLGTYRAWVHSLRDARIRHGAITRRGLQGFVAAYHAGFQSAVGVPQLLVTRSIEKWTQQPSDSTAAFLENPPRTRRHRAPSSGGIEPLHHFSVDQKGLDESSAAFLLVGLPSAPESVPVVANVTTGHALIFLGNIAPGARLWIRPRADGTAEARLEGEDVSDRLRSVKGLVPGTAWSKPQVQFPARALPLARGKNDLWFLPVAHFDALGLDRFLLALAELVLQQGRWDETRFDQALFYQDPAVSLWVSWVETEPASFQIQLPAGALLSRADETPASLVNREMLGASLSQGVGQLKAAGVAAEVELRPFGEAQRQTDRLVAVLPLVHREVGPTGADRLPDAGGVLEVTDFEESTYR